MTRRPPSSTLVPSTTLFRPQAAINQLPEPLRPPGADPTVPAATRLLDLLSRWSRESSLPVVLFLDEIDSLLDAVRSEEHTSELQSPCNIVCRLLLQRRKMQR